MNRSKKRSEVSFRAIRRPIFKPRRLNRLKVPYLKSFDYYIILQMTSNGRLSSQERTETAQGATNHRIDDSRFEAEVSPYSFERSRSNIEEKD